MTNSKKCLFVALLLFSASCQKTNLGQSVQPTDPMVINAAYIHSVKSSLILEDTSPEGIARRDYFAAMAMQGYLASGRITDRMNIAECSVNRAIELSNELYHRK